MKYIIKVKKGFFNFIYNIYFIYIYIYIFSINNYINRFYNIIYNIPMNKFTHTLVQYYMCIYYYTYINILFNKNDIFNNLHYPKRSNFFLIDELIIVN